MVMMMMMMMMGWAGQALQELSKDKPVLKHAEGFTSSFTKTLQEVENGLLQQINYLMQVTTGRLTTFYFGGGGLLLLLLLLRRLLLELGGPQ